MPAKLPKEGVTFFVNSWKKGYLLEDMLLSI